MLPGGAKMTGNMRGPSKHPSSLNPEGTREDFPDGSALVTYPDGSVLVLENALAKVSVLRAGRRVKYSDPPPERKVVG
jgi:hypothetical protein